MLAELWPVILTTMLPIAELRGGIPLGIALGLDPLTVIVTAFVVNCLIFFPIFIALALLYEGVLNRIGFCRSVINRAHKRARPYLDRYGILGLAVFIGIPLPITGVWTGTIIAWLLGLNWKKSFLSICLGVLISTIIVSVISLGVFNGIGSMIIS